MNGNQEETESEFSFRGAFLEFVLDFILPNESRSLTADRILQMQKLAFAETLELVWRRLFLYGF